MHEFNLGELELSSQITATKFTPRGTWDEARCDGISHDWQLMAYDTTNNPMIAIGMCKVCMKVEGGIAYND